VSAQNERRRPGGDGTASGNADQGRSKQGTYSSIEEDARQTPLTFRFKHRDHWQAIRDEIGGTETCAAVALALVVSAVPLSYSRRKVAYSPPRRYRHPLFRYHGVISAVDHLDREGLIIHDRAPPARYGWQSAMSPTDELRNIIGRILAAGPELELAAPGETIILRDANGMPVNYSDDAGKRRMRRKTLEFDKALRSVAMSMSMRGQLFRVFNQTFDRGGRFYVAGGGWQCVPTERRVAMTMDGEPVVELDFKSMHPAILYSWVGIPAPEDAYEIPAWPRALVKIGLLVLINASTLRAARLAIAHHDAMAGVAAPGSPEAVMAAAKLIDDIKRLHRPIAGYFHSDAGAKLMRVDSTVAEDVMTEMFGAGIPVLPVHDSFLAPASKIEILRNSMSAAAEKAGLKRMKITQK
jgi:hypothetical protein